MRLSSVLFRSVAPPAPVATFVSVVAVVALVSLASLGTATTASAQTVFTTGTPDNVGSHNSDLATVFTSAETFTFGSTTSFDRVVWYGLYSPNTPAIPDLFTISLYNVSGGTPTGAPFSTFTIGNSATRTPTGATVGTVIPLPAYSYSASLGTSVTLGAGTYGISIVNDTRADANDRWYWLTSNQTGTRFLSTGGGAYQSQQGDLAFSLINTPSAAPEPGSLALLALPALGGIGAILRRRNP